MAIENINVSAGAILDGRYRLVELLGEGGSGSTYKAIRLDDETIVAIKILSLRHLQDWKQLELFEREAQILAQLDHPQIPKYLEYFHVDTPTDRAFYIVQQLAPGKPLNVLVESGWHDTEVEIKSIASQILEILKYLQAQSPSLIHRDIKPHNIVRNEDGRVFLVDFGAVQETYNNTILKSHTVAGTYGYMAPEQFRGRATPASDLYGLGATILYLLTHRSPADLPQERLKVSFRNHVSMSDRFADWLDTMLEPDEADRFSTANSAIEALNGKFYRRSKTDRQIKFPWYGVSIAVLSMLLSLPVIHHYRYALTKVAGLQADLCPDIDRGDIDSVKSYLNQGGDVNIQTKIPVRGGEEGSLLRCAIDRGQTDIARYLLQQGADLTDTIADRLSESSNEYILQVLRTSKIDLNKANADGDRPLHIASHTNPDLAVKLIALGANIDVYNHKGETPLSIAINAGAYDRNFYILPRVDVAEYINLIKSLTPENSSLRRESLNDFLNFVTRNIADNNILEKVLAKYSTTDLNTPNRSGDRPLHIAIQTNDSMAKQLIARGVDVNVRNRKGQTPLAIAAGLDIYQQPELKIKLLLEHGANVRDLRLDLNHVVVKVVDGNVLKRVLSRYSKAELNAAIDSAGNRPLHLAIRHNFNMAEQLISRGVDVNVRNNEGQTPLIIAIQSDNRIWTGDWLESKVRLLLEHGADVNIRDRSGKNAIEINSSNSKNYNIYQLLKSHQSK